MTLNYLNQWRVSLQQQPRPGCESFVDASAHGVGTSLGDHVLDAPGYIYI